MVSARNNWITFPFLGTNPPQQPKSITSPYAVLAEKELEINLSANSSMGNTISFKPNTLVSLTLYIENTNDIPLGSTNNVTVSYIDWKYSTESNYTLDDYKYGRYFENYPIQSISFQNNYPVQITIYLQYILKQYFDFYSPVVNDLTQLQLTPSIVTPQLMGGTNFRYYGTLANMNLSKFPIGSTSYLMNQQVVGTSGTSTGSVSVPYTDIFTENLSVGALGTTQDTNEYPIVTDSTTIQVPSNVTSTNATMNWVQLDFYSPVALTVTSSSVPIIYDNITGTWVSNTPITINANAKYLPIVPAVGALITIT